MSVLKCDQEGGVGVVRRGAWEEGAGRGSCSAAVAHRCSPSVSVSPGRHLHCTIISDYFKHTWLKQFCGCSRKNYFSSVLHSELEGLEGIWQACWAMGRYLSEWRKWKYLSHSMKGLVACVTRDFGGWANTSIVLPFRLVHLQG